MRNWIILNVIIPLSDLFFGNKFKFALEQHRQYRNLSEGDLINVQLKKLENLLSHATTTVPIYANFKRQDSTSTINWLLKLPVITKHDLAKNLESYISNLFLINDLIKYESSGSTGVKSTIYMDKTEQANMRAILLNWWEWNGYKIGDPIFQTGMASKRGLFKKMKDFIFNTHYMIAFDSREEVILKHLKKCERQKEMLLFGYASSLFEIARVAEKSGMKNKFRIVMSQGDKLFSHYEKQIINAFGCKVVEDYGLNEGFMVGQKVDLPYFYIYTPSTYIEILDEHDLPVQDGQIGRIVLTKLDGYAMPLIRYDSGDLGAILPKEEYPSVRKFNFPLLKTIIGRNTDVVKTSSGNQITVHTFTGVFEYYEEIRQFQVEVLAMDRFRVKYIPNEEFNSKILTEIENKIEYLTGDEFTFEWELVEKINPSKSGKPQILINNLIQNSLSDQS